jgi:glycosyltransferase involved in cell wall biosynthesis
MFAGLPRRAYLTLKYNGGREFWFRVLTFPLRLTPFGHRLGLAPRMSDPSAPARRWYRQHARPVAVVIPTYGPVDVVAQAVRSVRKTTDRARVRIIVADDGSAPEHQAALRGLEGVELVLGEEQRGFAANCNRGLRATRPEEDVVLLNSDVVCHTGWLEVLQHTAYTKDGGIVGGKLLYPDGTIQFAGMVRNPYHPEWFDHRWRGRRADVVETEVLGPTLGVTGACLYATRACLDDVGELDQGYEMAFEDTDFCLRAWEAGHRVLFAPAATLTHFESKTRGLVQGERELRSQARFWERWGDWFDRRDVTAEDGGLRIVYVTLDTGVGGGHRVIFSHLNGLLERGHHPELWTLDADGGPTWFDLRVPVRTFEDFATLRDALAPLDAIKVATWWETADWVWEASLRRGIGVYLVQDIETSYYDAVNDHARVMASYRPEWWYLAGSEWVAEQLRLFATDVTTFTPGIDLDRFRPVEGVERRDDLVLALGRSNPLKDFPLTRAAYLALPEPRPELRLYGIEPELAEGLGDRVAYETRPSDARVVELLSEATVLLQTSRHEGFCLPALEGMAAGAAVVTTDANGNRDFCRDGENCLMPDRRPEAVRDAIARLLGDPALRARLAEEGRRTAEAFAWPKRLDELERLLRALAEERASGTRRPVPQQVA